MRSLLIGNKRIKVITHQRLENGDSWDDACFEFKEISKGQLTLSSPTNSYALSKLDYVDVFFYIAGKWKKFRFSDFEGVFEIKGQDFIRKITFDIPSELESSFETSFRIARCC